MLRSVTAPNPSALTLDGTRTYIVGRARVAIIDPGPAIDTHLSAVASAVGDGVPVAILITHSHPDHDEAAPQLARTLNAPIRAAASGSLAHGDRIDTDAGDLVAIATPGHTPDHVAFHWPAQDAIFCGDLMLGGMDTALVAKPEGDLALYLDSLERLRALRPRILYPTHGAAFTDPETALDAYVRHRSDREQQVLAALNGATRSERELVEAVYGAGLDEGLERVVHGAVLAYLEQLSARGLVRRESGGRWARA